MYRHRAVSEKDSIAELLRYLRRQDHGLTNKEWHQLLAELRRGPGLESDPESSARLLKEDILTAITVCEEIGLRGSSITAVLLHHLTRMGVCTEETVRRLFGRDTEHLLHLLLKVSDLYGKSSSIVTSQNFSHFLLSFAEDVRVILILIGDRLVQLRLSGRDEDDAERLRLVAEASFLYGPLAHRLGLYNIKSEMDDLCLKYTDRPMYDFVKRKLSETKESRDAYIASFIAPVREKLDATGYRYEIKGRTKSISSIRNKLKKQDIEFESIYDLFAIRIVLDTPEELERAQCWHVYSIITDMFQPNPKRLKDWISIPKSNGYESLHITVMGPEKRWVEVQIRTKRMDEIAEHGLAAHWKYKGIKSENGLDEFMTGVRRVLENKGEVSPEEIMQEFRMDLYDEEIYVFTPKGDLIKLPKGATVLDFAYEIHTRLGSQTVSAKVNDRNVSIRHVLSNGDTVSVNTSANQSPKADWLSFVVTGKARNKIKNTLRVQSEELVALQREELLRRMKNRKLEFDEGTFHRLVKKGGYKSISAFFLEMSEKHVDVNGFLDLYKSELEIKSQNAEPLERTSAEAFTSTTVPEQMAKESTDALIIDRNLSGVDYQLAKCCNPIYGDKIFAFVSQTGMKIHRMDCPNAPDLLSRHGYRVLRAEWSGSARGGYEITLRVVGNDDLSVVNNISSQIRTESNVTLRSFRIESNDGLFLGFFNIHIKSVAALTTLIKKLRTCKGVKSVDRTNA